MMPCRCEADCETIFDHPANAEDCASVDGHCAHLMNAGWRPVWVKVSMYAPTGEQNIHIFSRGGWLCPVCVARFPARQPGRVRANLR